MGTLAFTKARIYNGEKTAFSINGAGKTGQLHVKDWRRAWQPTPVFLPGESHGQMSLVGYSPWGCKESDTTEVT